MSFITPTAFSNRVFPRWLGVGTALLLLTACEEGAGLNLGTAFSAKAPISGEQTSPPTGETERDVEAPDVFSATETGLWDGRPSLGGVWVAHPDVTNPERVMIRNLANGQFVVGALFRRERDIPGPRLQISSDAASAIGVLAGAPVELSVIALRREVIAPVAPPPTDQETAPATSAVTETPLEPVATAVEPVAPASAAVSAAADPISAASTAIETAPLTPAEKVAATAAADASVTATLNADSVKPEAAPSANAQTLDKPYIQIGIFSVEDNANRTADQMRAGGLIPTVLSQESAGKKFWRVVVGPAATLSERRELSRSIEKLGFSDAYAVTN
jgi:cell division septation protein DedD